MDDQEIKAVARQAAQEAVSQALAGFTTEVKEAAAEGVTEALERVGIDPNNPTEVQQDFAFLRDWRTTTKSMRKKGLVAAAGVLVVGSLSVLWLGIKAILLD